MGQRGDEHIKHACLGVFYVYEEEEMGQWGGKHIKHARQACFMCWGGGLNRCQTRNTHPDGHVIMFDGSGEVAGWVVVVLSGLWWGKT